MKAKDIQKHEASFKSTGTDSGGVKHVLSKKTLTYSNSEKKIDITKTQREDGVDSYYYKDKTVKKKIVLHFTAGYLKGDFQALTKNDNHVSVSYLIARDGTIYNLFPDEYWSYHLGKGSIGGNSTNSKQAIGIELSNIGPLKKSGDGLNTVYGSSYCSSSDAEYYMKSDPFRDYSYFASHTDEQYDSLINLLNYLSQTHDIPKKLLPEKDRYVASEVGAAHKGIVSHINFRTSGKWDLGPAFDWDRLEKGLGGTTSTSKPVIKDTQETESNSGKPTLASKYTVLKGESIEDLEEKLKVPKNVLLIFNTDKVKTWGTVKGFNVGEQINAPTIESYTVKEGESLPALAEKFGISEEILMELNTNKLQTWGTVKGFNVGESILIITS